jgi:hypothetical protein
MYNINISFDTKHEKKANGYTSYGFYICECTQILQFEMFSNLGWNVKLNCSISSILSISLGSLEVF